ncbi:hypothetical protein F441_14105 [Phytophthora nicotianae CJ01A1]|uniref:Myb-like domain-containing protein n=6 Tax=Phytophthora nicotianae TaxID=4792 RepID=W2PVB2_PHYN3|nr:hypothetical protein PPTG_14605 [Phytophthora nicotianae INRA-310]ETI40369.1 hypothetical protein F443_14210 [Phytophthora nicotianae P1569]ETK80474.1 hypothetical protein L915_13850 [Phytophthora nicotianae]ETO69081.1 hypothetical protein F444_14229 [Phytophthora nicotianae P1976]ETP10195.1 hypothetical protein F441_14105 [Phytophthora nicotianae CJ01A1]ETP38282.1 hypothetical protein F442_14052 [Phytophthora nicotianae P10297]
MSEEAPSDPAAESDALDAGTDEDTIAGRTRTKFSLVDVPIDTLEASLPDAPLDLGVPETEEDREYQRFLSSLLPNEQVNLSFLDEEDEEYKPEEEEEDHEDEEARRGISKKELTDLLLDSTQMTFPKLPAAVPALESTRDEPLTVDNVSEGMIPIAASVAGDLGKNNATTKSPRVMSFSQTTPAVLRRKPGAVTQEQCIQLASQMHKHLQLLLQSYHLLASKPPSPALTECRAMIEELQQRGEKALKYKNELLSKLNPAVSGSTGGSTTEGVDANKTSSDRDPSRLEESTTGTENLLAARRVTRSLTAAHAAVAHPSMFELVGSQTVDELSAGFARGCSLEERDRAIQEQMLQLDTHLQTAKKRRKSKKGYSTTEDTLLAHGAKRFGTQAESWEQIQKHFLPTKTTQNIRHRYKYLTRPKIAMNAVKALHLKSQPQHHSNSWLLEEDLRIARGLVELHKEKYHFARLATNYLPHRSRLEIRKRWERLAAKFRSDLAEIGLTAPEDDSIDLAVAMKEYLEDKLRHRMLRQTGEAEKAKLDAALQLQQLGQGMRGSLMGQSAGDTSSFGLDFAPGISSLISAAQKKESDASCRTKNLHPALFFSSWSFISPATLLNSTCMHNWPSFMDEDNDAKDKLQKNQLDADVADSGVPHSLGSTQMQEFMPIAMPSDLAGTSTTNMTRMPQATVLMDARMAQKESEEEDDDSDYEHDELLSSENEGSDSDFEQLEFTDDDEGDEDGEDEASGDTFEQDTLMSDSDDQSVLSANSLWNGSRSPPLSPSRDAKEPSSDKRSPRVRHPLRLKNLGQPGNERMKRALAALERRIVGKSVNGAALSVTDSQTGSSKRAKRKVTSTLVAPLGANWTTNNGTFQSDTDERTQAAVTGTCSDEDDDEDDDWKDGSGDEEFEVVELPSSSDEFASDEDDKDPRVALAGGASREDNAKPVALLSTTPRREALVSSELPNKKAKLQQCPTCGHTTCTCSSSERMQLLLRRMKEKRSSSSLQ